MIVTELGLRELQTVDEDGLGLPELALVHVQTAQGQLGFYLRDDTIFRVFFHQIACFRVVIDTQRVVGVETLLVEGFLGRVDHPFAQLFKYHAVDRIKADRTFNYFENAYFVAVHGRFAGGTVDMAEEILDLLFGVHRDRLEEFPLLELAHGDLKPTMC